MARPSSTCPPSTRTRRLMRRRRRSRTWIIPSALPISSASTCSARERPETLSLPISPRTSGGFFRMSREPANLPFLRRRLLSWFDQNQRELPWRRDRDPYRIWVSEVMLQQTTVATVKTRFEQFLTAFPTLADLAAASEQDVLRVWEGLGYYRRARNLHAAARLLVAGHEGELPDDPAV